MSDNPPDLWRKVSAALRKLHSTCPKSFSFFFCKILSCFIYLRVRAKINLSSENKFRQICQSCILNVRELLLNYFFKKLFFNLVWNLSKDFSSFVEIFQQKCQKWTLRVQRITSTKTLSWLCQAIFDLGQGNVWFAAEILQPWYQICSFVSRWAIGRIVLKEFLLFLIFFRTSWEHFLVFLVYPSRLGGANWIPQAKMNISIRKKFVRKLFVLSGLWAHFFEHSLKSFRHVVKTTVYLFIGAIWERLFFFDFFKIVFGLWAIILQTSGEKFPQRCANCIPRVQRTYSFCLQ